MRVNAIVGVPPELQAYSLAKYSRSNQSLTESIFELSAQRAEKFLETYYFAYGHRSIADLAHITITVEQISMLAAFYLSDEPLWDGQSRSSRYQNFRENGYHVPSQLNETPAHEQYTRAIEFLFERYEFFARELGDVLRGVLPKPEAMSDSAYIRAVQARAFDVARYMLPLATLTSSGQVTSGRVLERQISRLRAHGLSELREIGDALAKACRVRATDYTEGKLRQVWQNLGMNESEIDRYLTALTDERVLHQPAAPTLVRYTAPDQFPRQALSAVEEYLGSRLRINGGLLDDTTVSLIEPETDLLDALVHSMLYLVDPNGRSYAQLSSLVATLTPEEKREVVTRAMRARGEHDEWLRVQRVGYVVGFDVFGDFGALRDLHRHRRCIQLIPDLKLDLGFPALASIFQQGLGEDGAHLATERGLIEAFELALGQAIETAQAFPQTDCALYLLPLAARQRMAFKMDLAEAAYLIELQSRVGGHFSYRGIAYTMYQLLCQRYPFLTDAIRATNPQEVVDLLNR